MIEWKYLVMNYESTLVKAMMLENFSGVTPTKLMWLPEENKKIFLLIHGMGLNIR